MFLVDLGDFLALRSYANWPRLVNLSPSLNPSVLSLAVRCVHGTCVPVDLQSYRCECVDGFHGPLCAQEDESPGPCAALSCQHGSCEESAMGQAQCVCDSGYSGQLCDTGKPCSFAPQMMIINHNLTAELGSIWFPKLSTCN